MKILMFGTNACPDCVDADEKLKERGADFMYLEFSESIANLKRFLKLRDSEAIFEEVKKEGKVGVPCFKLSDGTLTLSLEEVLAKLDNE